ncbi:hypothetical protein [Roseinatronobacter sp. S2]|nr:hypothetical protein [Roseinatronobacter sp. S2]WFE74528.1 hypothetical protein P8S53_15245 [Roseinatronobacter sp. S2]
MDWVVLTVAIVGLGVSIIAYMSTGALELAEKVEQELIVTD